MRTDIPFNRIWSTILLVIICIMLTSTLYSFIKDRYVIATGEMVTAKVVNVETKATRHSARYKVWVSYEYGGVEYEGCYLGRYNSKPTIFSKMDIKVNPKNPKLIVDPSTSVMGPIFMIIMFVAYIVIEVKWLIKAAKENRK